MSVPQHSVNIFSRPAQGNTIQRRVNVLNYSHDIVSNGWFDTMRCDVAVRSQSEGQEYLDRFLGCRVFAYADNPYEPMWEGLINRITFNSGGVAYTISLDEMGNRVEVKYSNDGTTANGVGQIATTTVVNSLASQGIYGIKTTSIEFGYNRNGNTGHPNALRDTVLAQRAFPQTSVTKGGGSGNLVTLECVGFYETLKWEVVAFTSISASNFDVRITGTLLPGLDNGTTFFDNTDFKEITANAIATTGNIRNGQTYWDAILKIAEAGNASSYFIAGVSPTNPQTGLRHLYYRQVNSATLYTARQSDGLQVRDLYGRLISPWNVKPDNTILVSDVLVGFNSAVSVDPRLTYISKIHYDANSQTVQWAGIDDTTASGAWMLRRGFKPFGRSFGANLRTTVS